MSVDHTFIIHYHGKLAPIDFVCYQMLRCFDEIDSIMIQVIPCLFSINRVSPLLIFQSIPSLCPYHPLWLCFSSPFMYVVWIYSNLACDRQMSRVSRGRLCELCSPRCSLNHYRLQHQTWRILPPICRYIVNSPCSSQEFLCFYFVQCVVPISNSISHWFPYIAPYMMNDHGLWMCLCLCSSCNVNFD